jgi:diguanylate cyclase (GGDEF)-like protein
VRQNFAATKNYVLSRCYYYVIILGTVVALCNCNITVLRVKMMAEHITTLLARKQIFFNQARASIATGPVDDTHMNDFINHLHETLDFYQLFDTFIGEFGTMVPFDSIEFIDEMTQTSLVNGVSGQHHYVYTLKYGEQSLGSMSITRDTRLTEHEIETTEVMLAGLTLPLRNALRYQQAIRCAQRDELTGLRNGSYYHDIVELEIERAQRYKKPFSLLMFDLDDFKTINTKYSNGAGDAVLVEVARRIEQKARSSDVVYRNGGDKFLVFLPNTNKPEAIEAAERIKEFVLANKCEYEDKDIAFTLSAGVVTVTCNDTPGRLMDRVSKALFHAKILGKNCIYVELLPEINQAGHM